MFNMEMLNVLFEHLFETLNEDASMLTSENGSDPKIPSMAASCDSHQGRVANLQCP